MKRAWPSIVPLVGVCLQLSTGAVCLGQSAQDSGKIIARNGCSATTNFERENYMVRSSRVVDPFAFLKLIRSKEQDVAGKIATLVDGKPFHYEVAVTEALGLIETENFLPDTSDARVGILLEFVTVENCAESNLNLVYHVYSTQIQQVLSGTPESRNTEKKAPQETAGLAKAGSPIQFKPAAGYNASESGFGGGRVEVSSKDKTWLPFQSLVAEGRGSSTSRFVSAALSGEGDSNGWLSHGEWTVSFTNLSSPTDTGNFGQGTFSGQYSVATKAFAKGSLTSRFGGLVEGGNLQSALPNLSLAPDTIGSTTYVSGKAYAGLSSRLPHNVFAVSYGLELGAARSGSGIDWRKHIGDVRHEFWHTVGDHRILEIESHLTVGAIQIPGMVPLAERFFGGNREEFFIPGDTWKIRANPVIRAIPANLFYKTGNGAGAENFVSYNLTAAWDIWRSPLIPSSLTSDANFKSLLDGQITSATSIEQNYYVTKDPHYPALIGHLPEVQKDLAALKTAVLSAESKAPGQFTDQFKACLTGIGLAGVRAKAALGAKSVPQYGDVRALLPVDPKEDRLQEVLRACRDDLNGKIKNEEVSTASASLSSVFDAMQHDFQLIDQDEAKRRATQDMAFVHRTVDTLLKEVNIYSVSPVAVLDVARIGPVKGNLGGTRYGPGGGLRFGLASVMSFTAGYAWNPQHRPGEGPGAVFLSLEVRDLFH